MLICTRKPMELICDTHLLKTLYKAQPILLVDQSVKVEPRWNLDDEEGRKK